MNKAGVANFLEKNIDTAQTALQGCVLLTLGVWLTFFPAGFVASLGTVAIIVVALHLVGNILGAIGAVFKGFKALLGRCIDCAITIFVLIFLLVYPRFIFTGFPLLVGLYSLLLGTTHLIVFLQYMHEHNTKPLRQIIFCAICFIFGLSCLGALAAHIEVSLTIIGVYFILFALTLFADFAISLVPRDRKNRMKRRIRVQLPVLVTALVPRKVLGEINKYFETAPDTQKTQLNSQKPERGEANVEVFVHVSPDGFGSMGHVDLCIQGKCISYGGYDEKAMKLNGGIGPGVLFEHHNKDAYIELCKSQSNKTLFGFGLCLSEEELRRINQKLEEIKKNTYEWMPPAHLAEIEQDKKQPQQLADKQPKTIEQTKTPEQVEYPETPQLCDQIQKSNQAENFSQSSQTAPSSQTAQSNQPDLAQQTEQPKQQNQPCHPEKVEYTDYSSLLYKATNAKFYKFSHGSFKYYFVLGTNCVKLADTLLGACGTDAVACGIIAPGTYYDFLNREYALQGGTVVSRKVY